MKHLPRNVYLKSGTYWHVAAEGKKRIWRKLTREREGLPAMYAALAALLATEQASDKMPALVADWQRDVMALHAAKTQVDEKARCNVIADAFAEFRAGEVTSKVVSDFLKPFRSRTVKGKERPSPRTFNLYRSLLRELMRYAIENGHRTDNPLEHIKTMTEEARDRYITDSELRRIKVAAHYGLDGKRTRSGAMLCALVDMAYLTGQRIGDLLDMRWKRGDAFDEAGKLCAAYFAEDGVHCKPKKTAKSSGASVVIEWTPKLLDVHERLKKLRKARKGFTPKVFTTEEGTPYTYSGAHTAWVRAVKRAGVKGIHFHDLRAKALTDKEASEGIVEAQRMGAHTTQAQTADYVRQKTARKTGATR